MSLEALADTLKLIVPLGAAFLFAFPIGWERERRHKTPGVRSFPLVALGACAYLLIGGAQSAVTGDAQARLVQGLLTGMGFIGGGAILKTERTVIGISTAVGIWNTGAIGAAVAFGRYEVAAILCVVTVITLHYFKSDEEEQSTAANLEEAAAARRFERAEGSAR